MHTFKLMLCAAAALLGSACSDPTAQLATMQAAAGMPAIAPVDESSFLEPDILRKVVQRDFAGLRDGGIHTITYLTGLTQVVEEPTNWMRTPGIARVVDPTVSQRLGMKAITSPRIMEETMDLGVQSIWGVFEAIADSRRGGASMGEEMANINRKLVQTGSQVGLGSATSNGRRDGQVMLDAFVVNPALFSAIYDGITAFANS